MPLVRPVTVHEVAVIGEPGLYRVHDPATPLLPEYFTRYSVIGDPPVLAGAVHVTARLALPLTATTDVGLSGTVAAGVAGAEFADGRLMPTAFTAITLMTYAVPLVRPVTVHGDAVIGELGLYRVHVEPLLLEYLTRYSVIGEPPSLVEATHVTARLALPLVATTDVGLLGTTAKIPIEFCETNAAMFELSVAELALEPLDTGFTDSICRGSSDSSEICWAGRLERRRRVETPRDWKTFVNVF